MLFLGPLLAAFPCCGLLLSAFSSKGKGKGKGKASFSASASLCVDYIFALFFWPVLFKILARLTRTYNLATPFLFACLAVAVGRIKHDSLARVTLPDAFT
jgi:hypothetical protein